MKENQELKLFYKANEENEFVEIEATSMLLNSVGDIEVKSLHSFKYNENKFI